MVMHIKCMDTASLLIRFEGNPKVVSTCRECFGQAPMWYNYMCQHTARSSGEKHSGRRGRFLRDRKATADKIFGTA